MVWAKVDLATKEKSGKRCLVRTSGTGAGEMILTLLAKVVALHIRFTMVKVREPGFERTPSRAWFWATRLRLEDRIHAEFCDSLEVFLSILGGSWSGNWSSQGWGIRRSHITWCKSPFFRACELHGLAGTNRAWWNFFLRARALCYFCGAESSIV